MNLDDIKFRKYEIKTYVQEFRSGIIKLDGLPIEFQKNSEILYKIPDKPSEPEESECCGTGCKPCVMDIYEEKLNDYEDKINDLYEAVNKT